MRMKKKKRRIRRPCLSVLPTTAVCGTEAPPRPAAAVVVAAPESIKAPSVFPKLPVFFSKRSSDDSRGSQFNKRETKNGCSSSALSSLFSPNHKSVFFLKLFRLARRIQLGSCLLANSKHKKSNPQRRLIVLPSTTQGDDALVAEAAVFSCDKELLLREYLGKTFYNFSTFVARDTLHWENGWFHARVSSAMEVLRAKKKEEEEEEKQRCRHSQLKTRECKMQCSTFTCIHIHTYSYVYFVQYTYSCPFINEDIHTVLLG